MDCLSVLCTVTSLVSNPLCRFQHPSIPLSPYLTNPPSLLKIVRHPPPRPLPRRPRNLPHLPLPDHPVQSLHPDVRHDARGVDRGGSEIEKL